MVLEFKCHFAYVERKFHNFSNTQILREINFGDYRIAKVAILTHLEALNFDFYPLSFLKPELYVCIKLREPKSAKTVIFEVLDSPTLVSRKI